MPCMVPGDEVAALLEAPAATSDGPPRTLPIWGLRRHQGGRISWRIRHTAWAKTRLPSKAMAPRALREGAGAQSLVGAGRAPGLLHPGLAARPGNPAAWLDRHFWPIRIASVAAVLLLSSVAPHQGAGLLVVGIGCAVYLVAYLALRRLMAGSGSIERRWGALISLDLVAITAMIPLTGGAQSPAAYVYLLPLVVGALVLRPRAALTAAAGAAAAFLAAAALTPAAALQSPRASAMLVFSVFAVTALAALVRQADERTRRELQDFADEITDSARAADRQLDLHASLALVGSKVAALSGATSTVILTRSEPGGEPKVRWSHGPPPLVPANGRSEAHRLPLEPTSATMVDDPTRSLAPGASLRSESLPRHFPTHRSLPLLFAGSPVGQVELEFDAPPPELDSRLKVIEPLLYHAALAIDKERRVRSAWRRTQDLVRLQEGLLGLTAGADLATSLATAAELSRELVGARYGAVSIWDTAGETVGFVASGIAPERRATLGRGPTGSGLLGHVARSTTAVRLRAVAGHPLASPLPPGHPPVTSFLGLPIPHLGDWTGAFYLTGKVGAPEFTAGDQEIGEIVAAHVAAVIQLHRLVREERDTQESLLSMLVDISDAHEHASEEHSHRVSAYARRIAAELGAPGLDLGTVDRGALLHDIGKLAVPESILQKPGSLTDDERVIMMAHAQIGAEIVAGVRVLAPLSPVIRHHHERWDGAGYPDRLAGSAIPLEARIVAVADAFDAITTDRPYRAARTTDEALEELRRGAGKHFDPQVVDAALRVLPSGRGTGRRPPAGPSGPATLAEQHSTVQTAAWRLYARLGQELRSVTDLPLLAGRILELLEEELGLPGGELSVLDQSGQTLHVVATRGGGVVKGAGERRVRGQGLMWAALGDQQTIVLADGEADPRYTGVRGVEHRAMIFVPLISSRGPQGVLVAHRPVPQAFDRLLVRQLEALAVPIAETLTVARLLAAAAGPA